MYLGLFVAPWILLYALSTLAMTHLQAFRPNLQTGLPWARESEQVLPLQFSAGASPEFMGGQILRVLRLEGNFRATLSEDSNTLTVFRDEALAPRRIAAASAASPCSSP